MDKKNSLTKKICKYDLEFANEIRGLQTRNSSFYDKASIYTRSDIYNLDLGNYELDQKIRKELDIGEEVKYILGPKSYVSFFTDKYVKVCDELYAFEMKSANDIIVSTYSRQYIYALLEKAGYSTRLIKGQQSGATLDSKFRKELDYYLIRCNDSNREIKKRYLEYKEVLQEWFGSSRYSASILNSGTAANWVCFETFYGSNTVVYLDNAFYYENINYIKSKSIKTTKQIEDANLFFLSVSNTNYFNLYRKYKINIQKLLKDLKSRRSPVIIVLDISADPMYRIKSENSCVKIVYTISLTKMCGDISLYFAGAIFSPNNYSEEIELSINKLGVKLDPIAKRFFLYPDLKIASHRLERIKEFVKAIPTRQKNIESWWIEPLMLNIVLHPPKRFFNKLKSFIGIYGKESDVFLRCFYHNLQIRLAHEVISNYQEEIVLGDSFGMSYMRMNVQGRDFIFNKIKLNIRFPRISFGYGVEAKIQYKILDELLCWINANWEVVMEDSFKLGIEEARKSNLN